MIDELFVSILKALFYTALALGAMIAIMMLDIRRIIKRKETVS